MRPLGPQPPNGGYQSRIARGRGDVKNGLRRTDTDRPERNASTRFESALGDVEGEALATVASERPCWRPSLRDKTCAIQNSLHQPTQISLAVPETNRAEFKRLILQIERDLLAQARLRTLLAAADATVVGHRQELQTVKARIKRDSTRPPSVLLG
jgi:hypothetical protein